MSFLQAIRHSYFADKNYSILYMHSIVKGLGFTVMFLYIGGWLYQTGLGLEWVFAYHAAHFALMGLFSPLSTFSTRKFGLPITYAISFVMLFIGLIFLTFSGDGMEYIIAGLFFSGLGFGLQGPVDAVLHAFYVSDDKRGKVFSVISALSVILSSPIVIGTGFLMDQYGLLGACILCGISWLGCSLMMFFLDKPKNNMTEVPSLKLYKASFSDEYKPYLHVAAGYQFVIIASVVIIPIILYLAVRSFTGMSLIAVVAMIAQTVIITLYGIWVDKSHANQRPLILALVVHSVGLILFSVSSFAIGLLFVAQTLQRTGFMLYMGVVFPRVHQSLVNRKWPLLDAGAVHHMQITFCEVMTLIIMAIMVSLYDASILPLLLFICIGGSVVTYKGIKAVS